MAQQTITVETQMFTHGEVDDVAYGKFVAKTTRFYKRMRDQKRRGYAAWTDEQCVKAAEFYCGMYRHHFRAQIRIDPTTRQPIQAA